MSQILPVNNPQQISAKVILITPLGSMRGNRQGGKSWPQIPWESISAEEPSPESPVGPAHCCCPNLNLLLNAVHAHTHTHTHTHTRTHTHTHTKALSFNLHASVLCKHRSDHTHWAVSLALIRLFVLQFPPRSYPCFVHCHSSGIMGCFHHAENIN